MCARRICTVQGQWYSKKTLPLSLAKKERQIQATHNKFFPP